MRSQKGGSRKGVRRSAMTVAGLTVEVVRKDIKNLNVGVYPPEGHVRVSSPHRVSDETIRLVLVDKLPWIHRQQARFAEQERQPRRRYVEGETHYYAGQRYRLRVTEGEGRARVEQEGQAFLHLYVPPGSTEEKRARVLTTWYRDRLKEAIPPLIARWEPILDVEVADWGVKRMKTRWGSCNTRARRIWLNLALAEKSPGCLEYVLVHEMVHLLEASHNARFHALMTRYLPSWSQRRDELNSAPLSHEDWTY